MMASTRVPEEIIRAHRNQRAAAAHAFRVHVRFAFGDSCGGGANQAARGSAHRCSGSGASQCRYEPAGGDDRADPGNGEHSQAGQ